MNVVISSFWTSRPKSASGSQYAGWIQQLFQLPRFKSSTSANAISYSNLLQVATFKVVPDILPNDSLYCVNMRVQSDDAGPTQAQAPVQVKLELVPPGLESSIHSSPMVFRVKDPDPLKLQGFKGFNFRRSVQKDGTSQALVLMLSSSDPRAQKGCW
ncbi:hypothetical protein HYPSUDRAFT_385011 [Hypholoma sublateritium FD-334 SS-4]|uniref:Uncharacterized protein n=1 Tax=Hypholoma sublateritium (strain FD-334 SS-4) TaxID=945553 RepID=A0A0D2LEC3_HYPSF|nr:hypothetical protein HYPSUDRAFT_385011 [Hypholoma sublateritium FD-334 SS-4]